MMRKQNSIQLPTPPPSDATSRHSAPYPSLSGDSTGPYPTYPTLSQYRAQPSAPYPPSNDYGTASGGSSAPAYPVLNNRNNNRGSYDSSHPPPSFPNSTSKSASNVNASKEVRAKNLTKFIYRYEINKMFADRLRALEGYEIVFVCDDSGSMNIDLSDAPGPNGQSGTRWDELKKTVSIVVDVATTLDPDGVDVYFLNRPPMKNVRSSEELHEVFSIPPDGATPIVRVVREILHEKRNIIHERKLLLLIATDGQPTDDLGNPEIEQFRRFLERERRPIEKIPVSIIACTDDDGCMAYLNDWDDKIPNLDVIDDYQSESKQIRKVQGPSFPFSFGDYVMKILLGGIDPWFGRLDNEPIEIDHPHHDRTSRTSTNQTLSRFANH